MLSKCERIPRARFKEAVRGGRPAHTPHLTIVLHCGYGSAAYAVVISKRVAPTSVARHTLRRRLLAMAKEQFTGVPCAVVIHVKKGALSIPRSVLRQEFADAARSLKNRHQRLVDH